jgi:DNA-binding SARP family transcriptional activator
MLLRARLFGTFTLSDDQDQPLDLGSPTTRALLAYLLLHRQEVVDRRRLAFLFWPRVTESAARRNLRQYLHHLRMVLTPVDAQGELILADGNVLRFNPQVTIWVDVEEFQHGLRPQASLEEVRRAVELYRGDLLEDLYDEWCAEPREHFRRLYLGALEKLVPALHQQGEYEAALEYAQRWVAQEPFDEGARRWKMLLYALKGDRARALSEYQTLVHFLEEELGVEPTPQTQALAQAIRQGEAHLPFEAQEVHGPQPAPARLARTRRLPPLPGIPLVDREAELSQLEMLYQQAQEKHGQLLLLAGEAGIGKTRLVQEYLARHAEVSLLYSICYELESMSPFAPLQQALSENPLVQRVLLSLRTQPPGWISALSSFLPEIRRLFPYLPASAESNLPALREALTQLILVLAEQLPPPLHLILDDLHWADTQTWEWLAELARRITDRPILIFGLYRPEDLPADRLPLLRLLERSPLVLSMKLASLSSQDTLTLARHLLPERAQDRMFGERLYQETEGNPFFIIETAQALQESRPGERFPLLATSIQEVIRARIERLEPLSREALGAAAAFGRPFSLALLHALLDRPREELVAEIENWVQRGLVQEVRQGYDFRHDKIRQVAYNSLSRARREYLHGRIAEILENSLPPPDASTLAYHYARSDQPLRALPYLVRAAEQALQFRSYPEARQFGLQAVNLLGQVSGPTSRTQRVEINLQLAQAYAFSGNLTRAIEILNETEHLAYTLGDENYLGQIFRRAAQFFWLRGHPLTASDYARRTLRIAEELEDVELLSAALRMLGRVSIALSAFDDAIAYLLRYVNLHEERYEALQSPLPHDLPIVLGYLGVAYARVGAWERAFLSARRGLELALQMHGEEHPTTFFARMQWGMVHADRHDWEETLRILSPIPDLPFDTLTPPTYMALSLRGYALAHRGEVERGIEILRLTNAWAERQQHRIFHYLPRLFLAESLLLAGHWKEAKEEAGQALQEAEKAGNRWAKGIALRLLAEIEMRHPGPVWEQVEALLLESMQGLRQIRARPDLARTYLTLRRLYDRAGQIAWAVDCHFRATTIFEELGMIEELREAQGQAAYERKGAVVIPGLPLRGPNWQQEAASGADAEQTAP